MALRLFPVLHPIAANDQRPGFALPRIVAGKVQMILDMFIQPPLPMTDPSQLDDATLDKLENYTKLVAIANEGLERNKKHRHQKLNDWRNVVFFALAMMVLGMGFGMYLGYNGMPDRVWCDKASSCLAAEAGTEGDESSETGKGAAKAA